MSNLVEKYVNEIVICDNSELDKNIKEIDQSVTLTNIYGSHVLGKTISNDGRTIIFLISEIVTAIGENLLINNENNIVFSDSSFWALKTLFHEFGHAKNKFEYGELITKKNSDNYDKFLNEHWKILRDEYLAEMFCANINRFTSSINWYGEFSDVIEEDNFRTYADEYSQSKEGLTWNLAFQILNHYYFIPLFHKAGFLDGSKQFTELENLSICSTISKILNYQVVENINVPHDFNSLVLEKWKDFQVIKMLKK